MTYKHLLLEIHGRVGLVTLNRPGKLNALCDELLVELASALDILEADNNIGCIVLTGSPKAFAAGADIEDMKEQGYIDVYMGTSATCNWDRLSRCRKPIIAAVAGYAFGGGCELAMMCDFVIAADTAVFAQPEVTIGIPPGAGGTQRLSRAIGKAKATDMCLTGRHMDAREAESAGLVARVVAADNLLGETLSVAGKIASYSLPVVMMIKECVNRTFEGSLSEGLLFERRLFHAAFALDDQKEGMAAFVEKRAPRFNHR